VSLRDIIFVAFLFYCNERTDQEAKLIHIIRVKDIFYATTINAHEIESGYAG